MPMSRITGDLQVDGQIEATGDFIGATKSLKSHRHTNVQPGGGVSGAPQ
jgi:phage baseplate assembly protein gpV